MSDAPDSPAPRMNATGQARAAERQARQAEALRANLRRRKEQVRARQEQDAPDAGDAPTE
ncbi:MAG: hypothetical protein WCZ23_04670 [Rhodospirillaceae bacterium]